MWDVTAAREPKPEANDMNDAKYLHAHVTTSAFLSHRSSLLACLDSLDTVQQGQRRGEEAASMVRERPATQHQKHCDPGSSITGEKVVT